MNHIKCACRNASLALCIGILAACGGGGGDVGTIPTLDVRADGVKSLAFKWTDAADETGYQLIVQEADATVPRVVETLPANTNSHALQVLLPEQWNARYWLRTCRGSNCVDSPAVTIDSAVLNAAVGYFKAPNRGNRAGSSVALSQDGQTLAIGVPRDDSATSDPADTAAPTSGAVLIFVRSAGRWALEAYVKAPVPNAGDQFGASVALSAQGTQLAVGAPEAQGGVGVVYTYLRQGGVWTAQSTLSPSDTSEPWHFGGTVSLSADGSTLAAGMTPDQVNMPVTRTASIELYTLSGGIWTPQQTLGSVDGTVGNGFGAALALSGNGQTLVVGARDMPRTVAGLTDAAGAVYVYTQQSGIWTQTDELTPSNLDLFDRFGGAVAVSADGQTIAVGATGESSSATGIDGDPGNAVGGGQQSHGAAYVYKRGAAGWSQQAYVKAPNTAANAEFGHAIALSADGDTLAVSTAAQSGIGRGIGATLEPTGRLESGAAYLFRRFGDDWQAGRYIKAPNADAEDRFGASIALSGDDRTLAVGAPNEDGAATTPGGDAADNSAAGSGAVYLY